MWEAVRKIFRPDEAPAARDGTVAQEPPVNGTPGSRPTDGQAPDDPAPEMRGSVAPLADEVGETQTASGLPEPAAGAAPAPDATDAAASAGSNTPAAPGGDEVSPPGHAPQGLAAESAGGPASNQPAGLDPHDGAQPGPIVPPPAPGLVSGPFPPPDVEAAVIHTLDDTLQRGTASDTTTESADAAATEPAAPRAPEPPSFTVPELTVPSFGAGTPATTEAAGSNEGPAPDDGSATASDTSAEEATPAAAGPLDEVASESATAAPVPTAPSPEVGAVASAPQEPAVEEAPASPPEAAPSPTPLAVGAVVGGRYKVESVVEDGSTGALPTYRATDTQSYERCWSCGSTDNTASTRFCQNCGAPVQDHPVTLVQSSAPTGEPGEVEQDGAYFHVQPERRLFGAEGIGIEVGAYSAEGPHHPNEDSYWYVVRTLCANSRRQSTAVVVFADGMGGYAPGSGLISARIASTAGQSIVAALDSRPDPMSTLEAAEAETIVRDAIAAANAMVLDEIAHAGEMGSTLVVTIVHGDTAYTANIGDSRAYYVDPQGRAEAITRDQSLVAQEVELGHIAASDVYTAPGNNIILHAVGEPDVHEAAEWYAQALEPGSYLMVCSDGYWKTLRGAVVPDDVLQQSGSLSGAVRRMVDHALTQGSDDNTTVVLIAVS